MTDTYMIEADVPMPEPRRRTANRPRFPLADLEVGESFFVPETDATPSSLNSAITHFRRKNDGWKFTVRKGEGGCRVWRVE